MESFSTAIPPNNGPAISATATFSSQPSVTFTVTQDGGDGQFRAGCPLAYIARVGGSLPAQCAVAGGTPPYSWSLTGGSYPAGITPQAFSALPFAGSLTTEGPFSFELTATDSSLPPQTAKVTVSGVVQPPTVTVNCSTTTGPQQAGAFYFAACEAKGGTGSYQWSTSDRSIAEWAYIVSRSGRRCYCERHANGQHALLLRTAGRRLFTAHARYRDVRYSRAHQALRYRS